jgi:hypothetical protein
VPIGKGVRLGVARIVRMQAGKIVVPWNNFDFLSMYHQLGTRVS